MTITCGIINNDAGFVGILLKLIRQTDELIHVQTFVDVQSGLEYLQNNKVDLLLINPSIGGLSIKAIDLLKYQTMIVFTSSSRKYASQGYDYGIVDYLLRTTTPDRFARMVTKVLNCMNINKFVKYSTNDNIFVRVNYKIVRIRLQEIEYIESIKDYVIIHQTGKMAVMTLMPLKKLLERLPAERFRRIHRSYVVAVEKIKERHPGNVQLTSTKLPVGRSFRSISFGEQSLKWI